MARTDCAKVSGPGREGGSARRIRRSNAGMRFLLAAIYVVVVVAVAGTIRWVLRRLGETPSFIVCVGIALLLLAYLATFVATFPWALTFCAIR
jgi:hypothetical protein